MSILWMDDPSFYSAAQLSPRYAAVNDITVTASVGRFGGFAWASTFPTAAFLTQVVPTTVTGTLAASFNVTSFASGGGRILAFYDTGTAQLSLTVLSNGQLQISRGSTVLATSSKGITQGVWYRIEFQTTINSTTGSIEVRVNGVDWIGPTTGLNTQNTSNASFDQIWLGSVGSSQDIDFYANDFFCTDSNTPNAGFLGDIRCFVESPNTNSSVTWTPNWASFANSFAYTLGVQFKDSNGNVQRCTTAGTSQASGAPTWATTGGVTTTSGSAVFTVVGTGSNPGALNWMAVAESPADGDSSYNSSSTVGQIDLFGITSLPGTASNIVAVDNILYARKDDAGTRTIEGVIKSGGTSVTGPNLALSTSYQFVDQIQQTDPNTSAAWTPTGVNAATIGYEEVV